MFCSQLFSVANVRAVLACAAHNKLSMLQLLLCLVQFLFHLSHRCNCPCCVGDLFSLYRLTAVRHADSLRTISSNCSSPPATAIACACTVVVQVLLGLPCRLVPGHCRIFVLSSWKTAARIGSPLGRRANAPNEPSCRSSKTMLRGVAPAVRKTSAFEILE